jgi:phage terminase large subunit GpA-like protein
VLLLTCGVDYQKNRLEAFVWGWGPLRERWLVDKVEIQRVTPDGKKRPAADIREELKAAVLDKVWPHALGGGLTVEMTVHDSSDAPADVFDIIDGLPSKKNVATKNDDGWGRVNRFEPPKVVDVKRDGKVVKSGRKLMRIHSAEAKRDWYDDLNRPLAEAGPSERYVHLPLWIDEESGLLEQFVAEEIRKSTRGKPYWHKTSERNEGLDCAVLSIAAHWLLKAHKWNAAEWARRAARVATERPAGATPAKSTAAAPRRSRIRGRMT